MSAIAGLYHLNQEPINLEHGWNIMKGFQQFPADDIQTWHNQNVFLGCHAQWITPESIGEQLPFYDSERQLAITADAIIDNRDELFDRLQVGHAERKGMPDSKLILLSYYKWGEDCPKYLVGDFAFMIWDEKRHCLFGARDFSGSRTLYFYRNQIRFAFCTTIQPLFLLQFIEKKLNRQWLAEFLANPDMHETIDTASTAYKNIEQIPPSHSITVMDEKITLTRYFTLTQGKKIKLKSNHEYVEAFREEFQRAVTARLRTHHNVGAHLSGGLDSGSVVSFAARALRKDNKQLHTFSYVPVNDFKDWTPKYRLADERPYIKSTVQHVGNISDYYFNFEGKDSFSDIDDWLEVMEMPYKFFENSFWLKGMYEEAKKLGIGVLLNGKRGNYTISWGPALDYYAIQLKKLNWIRLYNELKLYSRNTGVNKSRIFSFVRKKAFPFLHSTFYSNKSYSYPMVISPEFAKETNVYERLQEYGIETTDSPIINNYKEREKRFNQLYFWSIGSTNDTKLSLRHSLWERDPTNDLRVIQFCLSVPEKQFVQKGMDRALVRMATENYLPDKVRLNQRIRGIQGADGIKRMSSSWKIFIEELEQLSTDPEMAEFINITVIKDAIIKIGNEPQPEVVYNFDFKILMRSLIVYRFIKTLA